MMQRTPVGLLLILAVVLGAVFVFRAFTRTHSDWPSRGDSVHCVLMWGLWDASPFPHESLVNLLSSDFGYPSTVHGPDSVQNALAAYAQENGPDILDCYASLRRNVSKADLGRYLIVYEQGGLYLDNDVRLHRRLLSAEWTDPRGVWVLEYFFPIEELSTRMRQEPAAERVANYAFGSSSPRLPALRAIIEECIQRTRVLSSVETWSDDDVLWVCGPDVVSVVCQRMPHLFSTRLNDFCEHTCQGTWLRGRDVSVFET